MNLLNRFGSNMEFEELMEIYFNSVPYYNSIYVTSKASTVAKICTAIYSPYTLTHKDNYLSVALSEFSFGYITHGELYAHVKRIYVITE
jgi:hypothetical protein